jgi:thymidylate kinase
VSHLIRPDNNHLPWQDSQPPSIFGEAPDLESNPAHPAGPTGRSPANNAGCSSDSGNAGWSTEELCAAYLADPWRGPPMRLPWALCDMQRLLDILRKNKVPLLSLAGPPVAFGEAIAIDFGDAMAGSSKLQSAALFQTARQAEAEVLAETRTEYKLVHEALVAQGIAGVLIKSVGLEPSLPFKSDNLDVLYKPQDVERVRSALCQIGYVELRNVEEPHKYLFRKFHAGRSVSAIHVHAHVGWMTSFLDEERLWQRSRPASDESWLTIPAPEDALLTTLAHWFYEDKRLSLQDLVKCAYCLRQGVDWDEVYRIATWRGWRDGLDVSLLLCSYQEKALYGQTLVPSSVLEGAWRRTPAWARRVLERYKSRAEMPVPVPFLFSKAFSYAKLWRDPSRGVARRAKDLLVHTAYGTKLRLHIHSQPAMLVTFSGVDGCGKTTQARALQSAFETCLLRADYVWSRGGSASWIAWLNRWIRRQTGAGPTHPATPPRARSAVAENAGCSRDSGNAERTTVQAPNVEARVQARQEELRSPWKRWAWSWLTAGELLLEYTSRVTLPLLRGRVVICDRYLDDALADWSAYFGEESVEKRLAARVLHALTPRPGRAYWLDVPAEVAQSRSADGLPAHLLESQAATYKRWADPGSPVALRLPSAHVLQRLDGSQGWEQISDQVVYEVLSAYFSDYWTLVNWLFWKNPGQWR